MELSKVKAMLSEKANFNAYVKGTDRVRVIGTTDKMVKVNVYDGHKLETNDKGMYVYKFVKPTSLELTKITKSTSKAKGIYNVYHNEKEVAKDLSWDKAKEVAKTEALKVKDKEDTVTIFKIVKGVKNDKASLTKTFKKKSSKSRANFYALTIEGDMEKERLSFKDGLAYYKKKVEEMTKLDCSDTEICLVKLDKEDKILSYSRRTTIEKKTEETKEEHKDLDITDNIDHEEVHSEEIKEEIIKEEETKPTHKDIVE